MNVQDYLLYSAKITPDGKFFMVEIDGDGWECASSQGRTLEEAHEMARSLIFDFLDFCIELKRRIPAPRLIREDRYIINIGYDTALKIMLRNAMYDRQVRPVELAKRLGITPQSLNSILNLKKKTNLDRLGECFEALGVKLNIELQDE